MLVNVVNDQVSRTGPGPALPRGRLSSWPRRCWIVVEGYGFVARVVFIVRASALATRRGAGKPTHA